jgi:L-arabinose isomerase
MKDEPSSSVNEKIESFEVTKGEKSGDLLSEKRAHQDLKIGFLACGYFEYWRMYERLRAQVEGDMKKIADRLSRKHNIVYPGLVETLDTADAAGRRFKKEQIDLVIISEGTYCPDYFVHQALLHLSSDIPLILFASQPDVQLDYTVGYDQSLRNSGPMALVQLTGGFRKMGKFEKYEVVVGVIEDEEAYKEIDRIIQVHTTIKNLKHMMIGTVGHVFRGMYDFNFDKTFIHGRLGPHVMDIHLEHLGDILDELEDNDVRITNLCRKVRSEYQVVGLEYDDIFRAARLGIALQELIRRYKLHGLVLLGQHYIEVKANTSCYLGLSEILSTGQAVAVTEGDVLGCIMSKVLKDFTGHTAFFGEWEEIDQSLNAVMLLGHGFIDPRECRKDRPVRVNPACEDWGFKGNSVGFQATYPPGPVTMTHIIQDAKGWRLLISEGELLDTPSLKINECSLVVRVEKPIKDYFKELLRYGFSHHSIAAPGLVGDQLACFARQLDLEICRI